MFTIKTGSTLPILEATLQTEAKTPIDLTLATSVQFRWRLIEGARVSVGAATVVDAINGKVEYPWINTDTKTAGLYYGVFRITFSNGSRLDVPNAGYVEFLIEPAV